MSRKRWPRHTKKKAPPGNQMLAIRRIVEIATPAAGHARPRGPARPAIVTRQRPDLLVRASQETDRQKAW